MFLRLRSKTLTDVFIAHLPPPAVFYCRQLWQQYRFACRVVKPRRTRLGDFRLFPTGKTQITVNADLNPYSFLITYIHEVAHASVQEHYQALRPRARGPYWQRGVGQAQPHGKEWQAAFQRLMAPLLIEAIFPACILNPLRHYMAKPAATTYAHPALMLALRQTDTESTVPATETKILLKEVSEGNSFRFDKKTFVRGTLRRTRIVCKEVASGKSYAILAHAWVELNE